MRYTKSRLYFPSMLILLLLLLCAVRTAPTRSAVTAGSGTVVNVFIGEETTEPTENTEPTEPTSSTETTGPVESAKSTEATKSTPSTETSESAATVEMSGDTADTGEAKTGDQTRLILWFTLMLLALAALVGVIILEKHYEKNIGRGKYEK